MDIRSAHDQATLDAASVCVSSGRLIVLPTDTVYGIGADAFNPAAVANLLAAKGRGRQMPPPVLVGSPAVASALVEYVTDEMSALMEAFWPGALTIITNSQPSLAWDLGETHGTVALRMPDDETAIDLLNRTGPLAVSSANTTGQPAATTVEEASTMLGESVSLYVDGGPSRGGVSSTIVDLTVSPARILRQGGVTRDQLAEVIALEEEPAQ